MPRILIPLRPILGVLHTNLDYILRHLITLRDFALSLTCITRFDKFVGILINGRPKETGIKNLPPLPTRSPVPPPSDSAAGRLALRVLIPGGIVYTRENMGNV
ncbi:hypothetical protein Tco_0402640, partial [Tanacetum coccineum]